MVEKEIRGHLAQDVADEEDRQACAKVRPRPLREKIKEDRPSWYWLGVRLRSASKPWSLAAA